MLNPWKRARTVGYREGYAAGLRDAQRFAEAHTPNLGTGGDRSVAHGLAELAHAAQLTADVANRP